MDVNPLVTPIGANVLVLKKKWVVFERNEEIGFLKTQVALEQFGANAGDSMWETVHGQHLPNNVGIGSQPVLPERMRQNHDGGDLQAVIDRFVESGAAHER